jgi:hypothetical protein
MANLVASIAACSSRAIDQVSGQRSGQPSLYEANHQQPAGSSADRPPSAPQQRHHPGHARGQHPHDRRIVVGATVGEQRDPDVAEVMKQDRREQAAGSGRSSHRITP